MDHTTEVQEPEIKGIYETIKNGYLFEPLKFSQGGSNFKFEILKLVGSTSKHDSVESLISESEKIIKWINS